MEKIKILIPTDFTVQAEYAFLMVKKLEEKTPLDIHFLHVLSVPDTVYLDDLGDVQTCGEIDANYIRMQKDIADRKLANLKTIYGEDISTHLVLGKLTDAILNFSETNHFDLIVMGTKGAWGFQEKVSGSETQIIARKSRIPLLSVMCDRSDLNITNILLVHQFSNPVHEDLQLLQKIIGGFKPTIHFLQITAGNIESEAHLIEANMKKFAILNNLSNYICHILSDKDVENGVIHFNQMNEMDIICIGTHGKAGIFHKSATEKLINHLFKPIISFHLN